MNIADFDSQKDSPWTLRESSEVHLVGLAQAGSREAFDELCLRYVTMARRIANRVLRHPQDAEDAVQDSLLRAFLHIGKFDHRSKFSTWLIQITINSALMILRKRRINREVQCDDDTVLDVWLAEYASGVFQRPDIEFIRMQHQRMVDSAASKLPEKLRYAAILRYKEELQVEEVAQRLNITTAAAKSRLSRANAAIQGRIAKQLGQGTVAIANPLKPVQVAGSVL